MGIVKTLDQELVEEVQESYHTELFNDDLIHPIILSDRDDSIVGRVYYSREEIDRLKGCFYSVTTIIDKVLDKGKGFYMWLGNSPSYESAMEYGDKAATTGNIVHALIMYLVWGETIDTTKGFFDVRKHKLLPIGNEVKKRLMGFLTFCEELSPEIIATELSLYNNRKHRDKYTYEFAGTGDLFCRINGELWLVDVKTGKEYKHSHELQLTAYKILWDSLYGSEYGKIDQIGCLYLSDGWRKKPTYKLKKYNFVPDSWYLTLDLFKYLFPEEPRFRQEFPNTYSLKGEQEDE